MQAQIKKPIAVGAALRAEQPPGSLPGQEQSGRFCHLWLLGLGSVEESCRALNWGKQGRDLERRRLGSSARTGIYARPWRAPGPVQESRRLEQRGRATMAMEARRTGG
jgi:hypothetical protein